MSEPEGLLGRERELTELRAALSEACAGRGRFCLLAGEAGIGKSTLARAIAQHAEDDGMAVRWGTAWEAGGAPAFWPWIQVLRGVVREHGSDDLRRLLDRGAGQVAQLLPELGDVLPELGESSAPETDQARFELFDAVALLLRNASEQRPLAIVLDDLHGADRPSVLLLDFVARNTGDARIFLLGTYRDVSTGGRPEVEATIAELARDGRRIALRRLDERELGRLVEARSGAAPAPDLVRELHGATEGNPFFATEVVELLAAEGELDRRAGTTAEGRLPLPDTVREAIRRRFEPLGRDALATLELAAVAGRAFRLATLERVTGSSRDELIDVLDRAGAAGLVREVPETPGLYRFAHGLMRETLAGDMAHADRIRAHAAVGGALEELYATDPEPHLEELAHHFLEAAPGGHAEKAVDYAARAGDRAMRVLAYEQADRLFEGALGALDLLGADPHRRAELLMALGRAQVRAGERSARKTLTAAAGAARALGMPELLAEAALAFRAFARVPGVVDDDVVAMLEEALDCIGSGDGELRARLMVRLAVQLYDDVSPGAPERRRRLVDDAIAMARRVGDPFTLAYVLTNAELATWSPDTREEALDWSREVLELGERTGDLELVRATHNRLVDFLLELDDLAGADTQIEALDWIVGERPEPRARAQLATQRARRAMIEGRFDEAMRLVHESAELGARAGDSSMAVVAGAQRWIAAWMQGGLGEMEESTRRFADALPGMYVWRAALARVYADLDRDAEARREYERLAADDFGGIPRNDSWMFSLAMLAEVCEHLSDADRAATLTDLLEPFADRNVLTIHAIYAGPVTRYLGLLAGVRGDWDEADRQLAAAEAAAERIAARPMLDKLVDDRARLAAAREAAGAPAAARAEQPATSAASLRREGDVWLFDYAGSAVRVRDSKGLRYLARLLESPGVEIHALELAGGGNGGGSDAAAAADAGLSRDSGEGVGPLLDAEAKAAYRARLEDLQAELEEAESFNDPERAARAREEIEFVGRELAGAVGLGGRDRTSSSNAERARVNVTRSIRSLIKRIHDYDANLGRELEATVRTGTFCSYEPDPRRPVKWSVES